MRPKIAGSLWPLIRNVFLLVLLVTGIGFGAAVLEPEPGTFREMAVFNGIKGTAAEFNWKNVLNAGLPVIKQVNAAEGSGPQRGDMLMGNVLFYLTRVKINNPVSLLRQEIPLMASVMPATATDSLEEWLEPEEITEPPGSSDQIGGEDLPTVENRVYSGEILIALYNTHSSETFELTDGLTHLKGKAGAITGVTEELARILQETYHIKVTRSDKIHDTAFGKSYAESEKTVKTLLKENPSLKMLIDIHRDGYLPRERTLVKLGGQEMARILLVVGTDARASHPNWRKNLEFARLVAAKMDKLYPGLSRGISIKDGRYNQQHHPHGLLVEIGSTKNSTGEAIRSARLLANVLVAVLNDLQ